MSLEIFPKIRLKSSTKAPFLAACCLAVAPRSGKHSKHVREDFPVAQVWEAFKTCL